MAFAFVNAMTLNLRKSICISAMLLCAFAGTAAAGQLDLVVNGRSYHVNSEYDWNENNYGLGLEYQFDTSSRWIWSINGNAFMDSQDNISYMAGGGLKRRLFQSERPAAYYFDIGLNAFVMSRADFNDYLPFPGVLPTLSFGMKNVGFNVSYVPETVVRDIAQAKVLDPNVGGVFFLQFKFRLPSNNQ
jgi:palmitoyl transferase